MPQKIETVRDILTELERCFPGEESKKYLESWADSYVRVLGKLAPAELRQCFQDTMAEWRYKQPPKPADFASRLKKMAVTSVPLAQQERLRETLLRRVDKGQIPMSEAQRVWNDFDLPGFVDADARLDRKA